jgi:hypothetical protein
MSAYDESYPEFLRRVHAEDVERGQGQHKPGQCAVCDEFTERKGPVS